MHSSPLTEPLRSSCLGDLEAVRMKRQAPETSLCCHLQKALCPGESPRWMQWTSCDWRPWEQL